MSDAGRLKISRNPKRQRETPWLTGTFAHHKCTNGFLGQDFQSNFSGNPRLEPRRRPQFALFLVIERIGPLWKRWRRGREPQTALRPHLVTGTGATRADLRYSFRFELLLRGSWGCLQKPAAVDFYVRPGVLHDGVLDTVDYIPRFDYILVVGFVNVSAGKWSVRGTSRSAAIAYQRTRVFIRMVLTPCQSHRQSFN